MSDIIVMNATMARTNKDKKIKTKTEFHVHVNQQSMFDGQRHKVFDYSEYRLLVLIDKAMLPIRRDELVEILNEYKNGRVAISWCEGEPLYVRVKSER